MAHIRDRWMKRGPDGKRVRSDRYGRGLRYQVRWETPTGQLSKGFARKEAAEAFIAEQVLGIVRRPTNLTGPTFSEAALTWQAAQAHHQPSTRATVQSALNRLLIPQLGDIPVAQLGRREMQAAINAWQEAGYSASRIRVASSYANSILRLAEHDGLRTGPVEGVRRPKLPSLPIIPLTTAQVEAIRERMTARYKAMVTVAAGTGLRSGELRGLLVEQAAGAEVVVLHQFSGNRDGRPVLGATKTPTSVRRVPIGPSVQQAIAEHLAAFPSDRFLFTTRYGTPVSRSAAGEAWRTAVDGLGLPERSGWHDLRHFHASLLIQSGLSVKVVAERLGHKDTTETLRTYAHLWPTDQERAVAVVEDALRFD